MVVTIIWLIRPDTGTARSIPITTPLPTAVIYCVITCPASCFPVNPMVFRMPKFFHSCSTSPEMLCPITARAAPNSTTAKAAKSALKAFWRIIIKPAIVSPLWINSVYMESGVFVVNTLFISETVIPSAVSMWIMLPSLAKASIPLSSMTERISS